MKKHGYFILLFLCSAQAYGQVLQGRGKIVLEPFAYGAVKLTDGPLRRQLDEVKSYYLKIPNDDLLKGFRERMHLPTRGAADLGGWYSRDFFHVFGQIIAGLSRLYAVTGDEACRDKAAALIRGWAQCMDSTGYFFYSAKPNAPHYEYEKILGGLLDAYQFAGNKQALDYASRITDWCIKNLGTAHQYAVEWYTLTQNLYRAYLITQDQKYLDYGNNWEFHDFWNALKADTGVLKEGAWYHAYSHLNSLSGAGEAYLVKGDKNYITTLKNGYDFFIRDQCFVTGGFGPSETLFPAKRELMQTFRNTHNTFETQCGSWAAFKLCKYLLMLTGDGRYGDWIEKLMINGIGAGIPMSADGRVMYYSDYNPREGMKQNVPEGWEWSCCTGTRPEAVAEYAGLVYFNDHSGVYVNVYTPSAVTWKGVTLTQETRFPQRDEVSFRIKTSAPRAFALHFRKPSWLKKQPEISVNGQVVEAALSDNWYRVDRQWKDGDHIRLVLPMDFAVSRLDTSEKYPAAITRGPVVLAVRSGDFPYPAGLLESPAPWKDFIPVPGAALNYHVRGKPGLLIRPYYEFKAGEPYILYIDPAVEQRIPGRKIKATGDWESGGHFLYSGQAGAAVTAVFKGTSVKWKGYQFDDAGKFRIEIDGKERMIIDQYGPVRGAYFEKEFKGLTEGMHTIVLTVLPDKNKLSKGNYVNYIGFEVPD